MFGDTHTPPLTPLFQFTNCFSITIDIAKGIEWKNEPHVSFPPVFQNPVFDSNLSSALGISNFIPECLMASNINRNEEL